MRGQDGQTRTRFGFPHNTVPTSTHSSMNNSGNLSRSGGLNPAPGHHRYNTATNQRDGSISRDHKLNTSLNSAYQLNQNLAPNPSAATAIRSRRSGSRNPEGRRLSSKHRIDVARLQRGAVDTSTVASRHEGENFEGERFPKQERRKKPTTVRRKSDVISETLNCSVCIRCLCWSIDHSNN